VTRRRLLVTVAVAVLATFMVAATAVWLALPSLARRVVVWQVEAQTGRRLTMDAFDLDVRGGRLRIAGLRLADREPGPPLAEFERLDVRFRPAALLRGHLHVEEIALAAPRVRIVRLSRGVLNISDLLDRPRKPSSGVSPLTLDRLALTGGAVLFEDRTLNPPRTWRADGLTIDAAALSTVSPEPRGSLRLAVTVAGAPLSVEASSVRLAPPMQGRARVTLQNVDATLANLYLPADTAVALDRAVIGAAFDAAIDAQGGVGLDGQAHIDNLVVRRRGVDTSLVTVPALTFALTSGKSPEGRLLARVEVNGRATVFDPRPGQSTRFEIDKLRLVADGLDATGRASARLTASLSSGMTTVSRWASSSNVGALEVPGNVAIRLRRPSTTSGVETSRPRSCRISTRRATISCSPGPPMAGFTESIRTSSSSSSTGSITPSPGVGSGPRARRCPGGRSGRSPHRSRWRSAWARGAG